MAPWDLLMMNLSAVKIPKSYDGTMAGRLLNALKDGPKDIWQLANIAETTTQKASYALRKFRKSGTVKLKRVVGPSGAGVYELCR